ncbi:hypothetical protein D9M71_774130 [compost metagenome]
MLRGGNDLDATRRVFADAAGRADVATVRSGPVGLHLDRRASTSASLMAGRTDRLLSAATLQHLFQGTSIETLRALQLTEVEDV